MLDQRVGGDLFGPELLADVAVLGIFVYHPEGCGKPAEGIIVERGRCGQYAPGILHFFLLFCGDGGSPVRFS